MILLVHLLFGAAIGASVKNIPIAIILAFVSHYFLDLAPHAEYGVQNIVNKNWKKSIPDFLKILVDSILGLLIIFLFSKNYPIIYACAAVAILPDASSLLNLFLKNRILETHKQIHTIKIHFLKYKKISSFWRITSQIAVVIISIILLKT